MGVVSATFCGDEFLKVVDYHVMRGGLVEAGCPSTLGFAHRALSAMLRAPIVLASIHVTDCSSGYIDQQSWANPSLSSSTASIDIRQ